MRSIDWTPESSPPPAAPVSVGRRTFALPAATGWIVALLLLLAMGAYAASQGGCRLPIPWATTAPIADKGFRVLFVDESKQSAIGDLVADKEVRAYLDSHCEKVNGHPEWRVFDPDRNTEYDSPIWQTLFKRERKSVPWLVCSNGRTGWEGPCPTKPADALQILKRYGGP